MSDSLFTAEWSEKHQAYMAHAPWWPNLIGLGPTEKDAVDELEAAIRFITADIEPQPTVSVGLIR